jgi:hypothetical protein
MQTPNENDIDSKIKSLIKRLKKGYETASNEAHLPASNHIEYFVYLRETENKSNDSVSLSQLRLILMASVLANLSKTKLLSAFFSSIRSIFLFSHIVIFRVTINVCLNDNNKQPEKNLFLSELIEIMDIFNLGELLRINVKGKTECIEKTFSQRCASSNYLDASKSDQNETFIDLVKIINELEIENYDSNLRYAKS